MKKTFIVIVLLNFIVMFLSSMEPKSEDGSNALLSSFMMMKYPESSQKAQVAIGQSEDHKNYDEDKEALKWQALWALQSQNSSVRDSTFKKDTTTTPDINLDSREEAYGTGFKRYTRLCTIV